MAQSPVSSLQRAADESRKRERFESTFSNLFLSESQTGSVTTSSSSSASAQLLQIKMSETQQRQRNEDEEAKLRRIVIAQHEKNKNRVSGTHTSKRNEDSVVVNALVGMHQSDIARLDESRFSGASRRAMKSGGMNRRMNSKQQRNTPNDTRGKRRDDGKSAVKLAAKASSGRRSKF